MKYLITSLALIISLNLYSQDISHRQTVEPSSVKSIPFAKGVVSSTPWGSPQPQQAINSSATPQTFNNKIAYLQEATNSLNQTMIKVANLIDQNRKILKILNDRVIKLESKSKE